MNKDSGDRRLEQVLGIANTVVWGGVTALLVAGAVFSAVGAFNAAARNGNPGMAVFAASLAVAAGALATGTSRMVTRAARTVFPKPPEKKQDLPPFFAGMFKEEKGDFVNPPSPQNPDKPEPGL